MTLGAPTTPVFAIALVLAVLALLGNFVPLPILTTYDVWIALAAYLVLALGTVMRA